MAVAESTPERWEYRAQTNDYRCPTHDHVFERGESCLECVLSPGPALADAPREEDHLEKELRLIEAECHKRAKRCWRVADEQFDGTDRDVSSACKASAESAKWTRIALDIHERRTVKHELADLIKKYRALLGKDGSN